MMFWAGVMLLVIGVVWRLRPRKAPDLKSRLMAVHIHNAPRGR